MRERRATGARSLCDRGQVYSGAGRAHLNHGAWSNDVPGLGIVQLGDKTGRNNGANGRYTIEVENNGLNAAATRSYTLRCHSSSGHTSGDLLRWNEPVVRF